MNRRIRHVFPTAPSPTRHTLTFIRWRSTMRNSFLNRAGGSHSLKPINEYPHDYLFRERDPFLVISGEDGLRRIGSERARLFLDNDLRQAILHDALGEALEARPDVLAGLRARAAGRGIGR